MQKLMRKCLPPRALCADAPRQAAGEHHAGHLADGLIKSATSGLGQPFLHGPYIDPRTKAFGLSAPAHI